MAEGIWSSIKKWEPRNVIGVGGFPGFLMDAVLGVSGMAPARQRQEARDFDLQNARGEMEYRDRSRMQADSDRMFNAHRAGAADRLKQQNAQDAGNIDYYGAPESMDVTPGNPALGLLSNALNQGGNKPPAPANPAPRDVAPTAADTSSALYDPANADQLMRGDGQTAMSPAMRREDAMAAGVQSVNDPQETIGGLQRSLTAEERKRIDPIYAANQTEGINQAIAANGPPKTEIRQAGNRPVVVTLGRNGMANATEVAGLPKDEVEKWTYATDKEGRAGWQNSITGKFDYAPAKPQESKVTWTAPTAAIFNGKQVFVRFPSDNGKPVPVEGYTPNPPTGRQKNLNDIIYPLLDKMQKGETLTPAEMQALTAALPLGRVSQESEPPPADEAQQEVPFDPTAAAGGSGMVINNLNSIADFLRMGTPGKETAAAYQGLANLALRTKGVLSAITVPGRPTNYLLSQLNEQVPDLGNFKGGPSATMRRLTTTREMLAGALRDVNTLRPSTPAQMSLKNANSVRVRSLLKYYDDVIARGNGTAPSQGEPSGPTDAEIEAAMAKASGGK